MLGMVSGGGDGTFAALMQATPPNQGNDVKVVVVDAGHYFVDEVPQVVIDEFTKFFD
ncbi:hypothetical protein [Saccharothrix sp. NRRL B-16348]|jgi:hypothetical protein|uniref:hypothetical protein n=1 Tax=Saccharothrix sp. NRRL B-16348 TaxID=1415542 RepID=UPI000B0BFBF1|nr:hypothetical protein [Saccharothrix sp. NRRL B-16348]